MLDYLKSVGLTEVEQLQIRLNVEELKRRHSFYGTLYVGFARLAIIPTRATSAPRKIQGDGVQETIQILDPNEWVGYLNDIDCEQSFQTLRNAMDQAVPLERNYAEWLFQMRQCALFMERVWHHPMLLESAQKCPLHKEDLVGFVGESAAQWARLAHNVAEGTLTFHEMDEIIRLQPDASSLAQKHLKPNCIEGAVQLAYRNFRSLQELRHIIGPFVSALRLFSIREKDPIDKLHHFVKRNLLEHWDTMTLAQATEAKIFQVLSDELGLDPERPEIRDAMQFISSLVTDGNSNPLIEWLREKNERDMEAMGKILQGPLLVAYGNF